ncbi:MAG: TIGR01777 family oxidoreductase [Corynebacterium sp.]|nr:TIGR01777 family oxidoreductase [Corynebacterium sp.]
MSLNTSHVVPAPREDVWAWHSRPGAVARLTPPFFPFTPMKQTTDLARGTTVLALPAGLKWEAQHDLSGYVKGFRFTDVCTTAPIKALASWRHSHSFMSIEVDGEPATKVTDEVYTRLPESSIAPMFAYRQQQLIHDMAAMYRFQRLSSAPPLTVAITGSRGLVGRALMAQLTTLGHKVIQLVRTAPKKRQRQWDPQDPAPTLLDGVDVLVHLAGEPIMGRFTDAHKKALWDSRIEPTAKLAALVGRSPRCTTMISASAIGFYGFNRGDEELTEESSQGEGFLAELSQEWEASCLPASARSRVVNVRTGVLISGRGGMLPVLRTLFSTGLGGHFDGGTAWFSWIALDDLTDIIITAILDSSLSGPVNAVAPNPIQNSTMAQILGKQLRRPARFPIPNLGPKILLGTQGAEEFALADQQVQPAVLLDRGHTFRYPLYESALAHELGNEKLFDAATGLATIPDATPAQAKDSSWRWWRWSGRGKD